MTSQTTFYFSQLTGRKFLSAQGNVLGKIRDLLIDLTPWSTNLAEPVRPRVIAVQVRTNDGIKTYDFSSFEITRVKERIHIRCLDVIELNVNGFSNCLWVKESILDKQIVDLSDKKLVRVRDIRLVMIPSGTFALAVDVGPEGWLRRFGLNKPVEALLERIGRSMPDDMILWDDMAAVDYSQSSIKLSKSTSKLHTLHPSDLADIIEDLDKSTRTYFFSQLDEEQAADVLEELEPEAQIHLVESLPKEKVADVLEKMPADEVADILDELADDKAEELLREMEHESSEEVRELLEYPDKVVGSIMSTDFMTFREDLTVEEALWAIRSEKPEPSCIYSLFVVDHKDRLLSSIPLGALAIADPHLRLKEIMKKNPKTVFDDDGIDTLAEIVWKYNLLAVPVINRDQQMEGVVVVDDIVDDLMGKRKTK
jgi:CBS domain-containing protein